MTNITLKIRLRVKPSKYLHCNIRVQRDREQSRSTCKRSSMNLELRLIECFDTVKFGAQVCHVLSFLGLERGQIFFPIEQLKNVSRGLAGAELQYKLQNWVPLLNRRSILIQFTLVLVDFFMAWEVLCIVRDEVIRSLHHQHE